MSRYIDIDDAIEIVTKTQGMWATTLHALCDAPKIDIVRCKECRHSDESLVEGCVYCNEMDRAMDENGFCHKGEREGE